MLENAKLNNSNSIVVDRNIPEEKQLVPIKNEERVLFMILLTLTGGFINAYSFFVCGGVFASVNTGNMIKAGMSVYTQDMEMFITCIVPSIACVIGAVLARIVDKRHSHHSSLRRNNTYILIQIAVFIIIGFLPEGVPYHYMNFALGVTCGYQLSTFRFFNDMGHNSTNMAGNLRNMGFCIGDCLYHKFTRKTVIATIRYYAILISFMLGAYIGAALGTHFGKYAIWFGCISLIGMLIMLNMKYKNKGVSL